MDTSITLTWKCTVMFYFLRVIPLIITDFDSVILPKKYI